MITSLNRSNLCKGCEYHQMIVLDCDSNPHIVILTTQGVKELIKELEEVIK